MSERAYLLHCQTLCFLSRGLSGYSLVMYPNGSSRSSCTLDLLNALGVSVSVNLYSLELLGVGLAVLSGEQLELALVFP